MVGKGLSYGELGASSTKEDVHRAISGMDQGLFPDAFCKIVPDSLTGSREHCMVVHSDGAGTKSILAYLWYRETGDASVFRGIAQDSAVMNLDDAACAGATGPFTLSNTIGRNAGLVPGEIISELIQGYHDFAVRMMEHGVAVHNAGGETADMGDAIRTIVADSTLVARLRRDEVVRANAVQPGDDIIGLSGTGKAAYEDRLNSGLGSNGLTLARHALLSGEYLEKYPEIADPGLDRSLAYSGPYRLDDEPDGLGMSVGEALLSPTRTYAPVVRRILEEMRADVHALLHCTGGGQTKCLRFGQGIRYVKDGLFPTPPVFGLIQDAGNVDWREMYRTFNMGHRLEVVVPPEMTGNVIRIAKGFGVEARKVGHCESSGGGNSLTINSPYGELEYSI